MQYFKSILDMTPSELSSHIADFRRVRRLRPILESSGGNTPQNLTYLAKTLGLDKITLLKKLEEEGLLAKK